VGNTAFFLALDRLAQRRKNMRVSTDDLQAILEETSGQDLSDFFDYWIHGGRIPKVSLTYALVDQEEGVQQVEACVSADIPFGSFDVPVEIKDASGEVAALVDVNDGSGEFSVPGRSGDIEVLLDKDTHMVLYKRSVKQVSSVDKLPCKASK
jgi:aminopeptidase N